MKSTYTVQMLDIARISPDARGRKLDPKTVDTLARSISTLGMLNPITVLDHQQVDIGGGLGDGYRVLAGNHRFAAALKLCMDEVPCIVMADEQAILAELTTIGENLSRLELSTAERSLALARREEIYEAVKAAKQNGTPLPDALDTHIYDRPTTLQPSDVTRSEPEPIVKFEVGQSVPPQNRGGLAAGRSPRRAGGARPQATGFGSAASQIDGNTKRSENRSVRHVHDLGDTTVRRAVRTSLDSHPQLAAMAELDPAEREQILERAEAGEEVSAVNIARAKRTAKDPARAFFAGLAKSLDATLRNIEKATGTPIHDVANRVAELAEDHEVDATPGSRIVNDAPILAAIAASIDEFVSVAAPAEPEPARRLGRKKPTDQRARPMAS